MYVQLVAKKKTGNENFSNVNLVLAICQLLFSQFSSGFVDRKIVLYCLL
jgi:hypothetical protein